MRARRLGAIAFVVMSYAVGVNAAFYGGILPLIGGVWSWGEHGMILFWGLGVSIALRVVSDLLKHGRNIGRLQ